MRPSVVQLQHRRRTMVWSWVQLAVAASHVSSWAWTQQAAQLNFTQGAAVMLIISAPLLHDCYSSSSSHAQIQHTREGTGGCTEHTSILLHAHWITATRALFPCSLGVVLRFKVFVAEAKACPRPSSDWSSRANHFCFCASHYIIFALYMPPVNVRCLNVYTCNVTWLEASQLILLLSYASQWHFRYLTCSFKDWRKQRQTWCFWTVQQCHRLSSSATLRSCVGFRMKMWHWERWCFSNKCLHISNPTSCTTLAGSEAASVWFGVKMSRLD